MLNEAIRNSHQRAPLTQTQTEIWLEQCIHPESTQYIIAVCYRIPIALDVGRFLAATDWVFSHHDALYARLTAGPSGVPEVVFDSSNAPQCRYVDLSGEFDPDKALQSVIDEQARTLFTLLDAPLGNPVLIRVRDNESCYLSTYHHILIDGWGVGEVFAQIAKAYEELERGETPTTVGKSYCGYLNQSARRQDLQLDKARAFWTKALASALPVFSPRHECQSGESKLAVSFTEVSLARDLAVRVSAQFLKCNATLFHALLLAYACLLRELHSSESYAVSLPILNRSKEDKQTIGLYVESRVVPLPLELSATVGENLSTIARHLREVYRYYRLPNSEMGTLYQRLGNPGRPTADSSISYITKDYSASIEDVPIQMANVPAQHAKLPFALYVFDTYPDRDIRIELVYQHRYLNREEADLFTQRLLYLLERFASELDTKLDDIDGIPREERRRITSLLQRQTEFQSPARPIIEKTLERAYSNPDAIAVETGDSSYSYRECIGRANAIAHALVERHAIHPGDRVGLFLPRGVDLIATYLAVMMTGATFVPLDLQCPELRIRQVCEDAGVKCLVVNAATAGKLAPPLPPTLVADALPLSHTPFATLATPEQVAYIIYTSGSTGRPKGVEVSHRALADHIASWLRSVPLREANEKLLFFHSPAFDASIECIFPALLLGNVIVTAPHPQWAAHEIANELVARQVTVLYLPPAYLVEFLKHVQDHPAQLEGHAARMCLSGGEAMHAEVVSLWEQAFGPSARLFNVYGPTETVVTATTFAVPPGYRPDPGESVPIGIVHAGRTLRIVDDRNRDVPIGVEGELLIGGIGLADGYHGMPAATAERFIVLDGIRFYRSGDIVKLNGDGLIVFCCRKDRQIKIRGFRIEPEEIEGCLLQYHDVRECAVLATRSRHGGERNLRACVSLLANSQSNRHSLRQYLATRLPDYMIPQITIIDSLPKNVSGKIDYRALDCMLTEPEPSPSGRVVCVLQGAVQEYLALLWQQVLGIPVVDAGADFFELGGHSLLATRLVASIGKAFRIEFPVSAFFDQPTIAATGQTLQELVGDTAKLETMAELRIAISRMSPDEVNTRLEVARQKSG